MAWNRVPKYTNVAKSAPRHNHDDHGKQVERGKKLYTYCTCGHLVAVDKLDDED